MTGIEKAEQYIDDVLSGSLLAPSWIVKAMQRHKADLKKKWKYYFDRDEAERVLDIFPHFRFAKGSVSGQPFEIMPWFAAFVYLAYGWRRDGGGRRFRTMYCKVPRGNAKTANLVNIATIGFMFDGQGDSEVYWLAMNKDQAKIGWDRQREMLREMIRDFPELDDVVDVPDGKTSSRISLKTGLSWVGYVGQDSKGRDGFSPYYIICDEFHEWPNTALLNKYQSGMVKVDDPCTWIITTAGYLPNGPNSQILANCKKMLDGLIEADEMLAFIYEMDKGDDWRDPAVWAKVNPGIGISVTMDSLETEYNKISIEGQTKEIDFRVKNLNEEYNSQNGWIPGDVWARMADSITLDDFKGREVWAGLDLASTDDFNALVLFSPENPNLGQVPIIKSFFWIPEGALIKHKNERPFVLQWADEGHVKTTLGSAVDYDVLLADMVQILSNLNLKKLAYDPAFSSYIAPKMEANALKPTPYTQGWAQRTPPAHWFERTCTQEALRHCNNPVANWMLSNVTLIKNQNDAFLPSKGHSAGKIDFVAALINAVGQQISDKMEPAAAPGLFFI